MQQIFAIFRQQLNRVSTEFKRYLYDEIRWENRLIAVTGSRGAGKTTLLLQYIKLNFQTETGEVLFASLDNLWFTTHSLIYLADEFHKQGGRSLFLDEVHYYKGWSREIKNIYDSYPDMKIIFTGSSLLEVYKGEADLSRRAITYHLQGLSYREFLNFEYGISIEPVKLEHLLSHHIEMAMQIVDQVKPVRAFGEYLRFGYYPYYKEDREMYHHRLLNTLNTILEVDLPATERIDYLSVVRLKKLLYIIASLVPFTPNITKLSHEIGTTRISLLNYLYYLEKAKAIMLLSKESTGLKRLSKPDKVYLENTNYAFALGGENTNQGNVRESFFMNQLSARYPVTFSPDTDFIVSSHYNFEIGGKNKTRKQIFGLEHAYIAKDNIESGYDNQIPLWLFGFLY
jgi:hypothetical protein